MTIICQIAVRLRAHKEGVKTEREDSATYLRVYRDLLEKFYLGEYRRGDKIPTASELCVVYGVGISAVRKTIKRLRDEGHIQTQSRNGTTVLFDLSKPEHLRAASAHRPELDENAMNTLRIPCLLISSMGSACIKNACAVEQNELLMEINMLLYNLQRGFPCGKLTREFFTKLIALSRNSFLINVSEDLAHGFVLFVPPEELDTQAEQRQRSLSILFFTNLRKLLANKEYAAIKLLIKTFYEALYRIPNVFLFSNAEHIMIDSRQEPLYDKVARLIQSDIVFEKIKKGELLPTQAALCKTYGVGRNTVLRACEVLKERGFVETRFRGGTAVIIDTRSAEFQQTMRERFYAVAKKTADALQALWTVARDLCTEAAVYVTDETILEMQEKLEEQRRQSVGFNVPMMISEALVTPLVLSLKNGRLCKYYFHITEPILSFTELYTIRVRNAALWCDEVYDAGRAAIEELRRRNVDGFVDQLKQGAICNNQLFSVLGDELASDAEKWDIDPKRRGE